MAGEAGRGHAHHLLPRGRAHPAAARTAALRGYALCRQGQRRPGGDGWDGTGAAPRPTSFPVDGPTRLRLERRRNVVTLYAGKEGATLVEMGGTELAPFSPMYAGLAGCAHDDKAETTAVFSDVTVEVLPPP